MLAEARELVADGVRELVIVAQDTTYYGMDLYGEPRLAEPPDRGRWPHAVGRGAAGGVRGDSLARDRPARFA